MPAAFRNWPSVAPGCRIGSTGTPGQKWASSFSTGARISRVSGGGGELGPRVSSVVTLIAGSATSSSSCARTASCVTPGKMRQFMFALARCGKALVACPASTMVEAGHATNALPQRASANMNCRIFPGVTQEAVRAQLEELVADPAIKVTTLETRGPSSPPPPLTREILAPVEKLAAQFWPGVPVLPILQPGATDGQFLNAAGIPTYGIEPLFLGPDFGHIHGLNEYVGVKSLLESRDFLYRLVRIYAEQR